MNEHLSEFTQEDVDKICKDTGKTQRDIWNLYIEKRIDNRKNHMATEESINEAIKQVAEELKIDEKESDLLYEFISNDVLGAE